MPYTLTLLRLAAAVAAIVVMAAVATPTTHAQRVDDSLPPLADLTISSQYARNNWVVTVNNNTVGAHPGTKFAFVKVRITISDAVGGDRTRIWTIRDLPVGGSKSTQIGRFHPPRLATSVSERVPQRLYAEIIESEPAAGPETPRFQLDNATENWFILRRSSFSQSWVNNLTNGDAGVEVTAISDRLPRAGGATTFTVHVENAAKILRDDEGTPLSNQDHTQLDVQVEINLSAGLAFAETQPEPPSTSTASTTFDSTTGIWNVGTMIRRGSLPLSVAVNLTSESLADLPLGERCLTAKVVRAVPWFASDSSKRTNDTATACLGRALFSSGAMDLFDFYPCIDVTSYPCTSADTLELVAVVRDDDEDLDYLQPEEVIIHVPDPDGRFRKGDGYDVIWSTVGLMDLRSTQIRLTPDWKIKESVTVTAPGGGAAPGRWLLTNTDDSIDDNFDLLDATDSSPVTYDFYDLSEYGEDPTEYYFDFKVDLWELGTYKALYGITGRKYTTDTEYTEYTDSGAYIFHVGPVSELEVRDAGPSPAVGADRRAYTVMAVNNGPDAAHAVEVTLAGVPDDAEAVASHGSYDPASGVWTIGRLEAAADQRASGFAEEGPTLTLTAAGGAPIIATIENPQEYCVRIKDPTPADLAAYLPINDLECDGGAVPDGYTERSVAYYDHIPGNNQAEIMPWPGIGDGHPDVPASLTVVDTPAGNFLKWEPVERVNRHPVAHYQIQQLLGQDWRQVADGVAGTTHLVEDYASGTPQYRVRAVNWMGVGGPWSKPTAAQEGESVQADDPAQPPDPTTGLSADPGDGYVDLKWRAHRSDGREIFWELWRSDDQAWGEIAPRSMGSRLGYTVTELENGTEHIFRVRAVTTNEYGDPVPGVSSGPVLATPTGPPEPPPGQTPPDQPSGPNTPPEFDRATAWADYCVNGGTGSGAEVARVTAFDQDGDRLTFYQVKGFDEIGDNHFTVSTVRSGEADWAVIRTSRSIPRNLEPEDGFISIDLEVNDGRGGLDQIGVTLQYDPNGRNCAETASAATGESGPSALAALMSGVDRLRGRWTGFSQVFAGLAPPTPVALYPR